MKIAIAACFLVGISAYAQDGFIRPEISYTKPTSRNLTFTGTGDSAKLQSAAGFSIAAGDAYGDQDSHEVSLSIGLASFKTSESQAKVFSYNNVLFSSDTDSMKVRTIPILFNYRYHTGVKTSALRFYFGPSFGATLLKRSEALNGINAVGGGAEAMSVSESKYPLNWAVSAGAAYRLTNRLKLDAGVRFSETCSSIWRAHFETKTLYIALNTKI